MLFRSVPLLVLLAPAVAAAQTAGSPTPPDKSGYWLLDPVPDDQLRAFSTDRPNKSNSPYTVDAGHFQYETDLFNYSYTHLDGTTQRSWTFADPVLKVGLTNQTDLELAIGGFSTVRTTTKGAGGNTISGFGDVTTRLKVNLFGNDGGDAALAVIPYVKAPTAKAGLGNGQVEGGIIAPLSLTLPHDFSLVLETELDLLKNGDDNGKHSNFVNLANLSRPLTETLTGSVELYSSVATDAHSPNLYTVDLSLAWAVTPTLQLDTACYIGLNREAPRAVFYAGLSQRF
jgi:hypothetical protein